MTSYDERNVRCFCCGRASSQQILASTNSRGSPDLDQRPPEMMRSTMDAWLEQCPSCSYVATDLGKGDAGDKEFVSSEGYQALRTGSHLCGLSCRFLLGAALAGHHGDAQTAFRRTLSAAWIADDMRQLEVARALRRQAAACVLRSTNSTDLRLRLLDVLRRSAEWDAATALGAEMTAEKLEHPLSAIVRFQSETIKNRDDKCYSVEEALSAVDGDDTLDDDLLDRIARHIEILPPRRRDR